MATPLIPWKEGQGWTVAVKRAVRLPAIPPELWAGPGLVLALTGYAYTQDALGWVALGTLALVASLAGLGYLGVRRSRGQEYLTAATLADALDASQPLRLVWEHLGRALDRLGWYEDKDVARKVPTGKLDENKLPIFEERHEKVREHPEILITSQDPANEARLLVRTTSGLVALSQVEAKGPDLADYLGLNGWVVEVAPSSTPGCIEIRLARFTRGGDVGGRVRVEG